MWKTFLPRFHFFNYLHKLNFHKYPQFTHEYTYSDILHGYEFVSLCGHTWINFKLFLILDTCMTEWNTMLKQICGYVFIYIYDTYTWTLSYNLCTISYMSHPALYIYIYIYIYIYWYQPQCYEVKVISVEPTTKSYDFI